MRIKNKTKAQIDHEHWFRKKAKRQKKLIEDLDGEIWLPVKGYEGLYTVSCQGRIKSLDRIVYKKGAAYEIPSKLLSVTGGNGIYKQITLFRNGKRNYCSIHRLVCEAFHDNPDNKEQVNHIDGNKQNNYVENLEWCTRSENAIHSIITGLRDIRGGKHFAAKPIVMCNMDGVTIEKFDYIKGAMDKYNFKTMKLIIDTAKGYRESAYGYKWKYL